MFYRLGMAGFTARYKLKRRLGAGGMAEVHLAYDTDLERDVALKILLPELAADEDKKKRFRSTTKAASVLTHPNICMIHEVGETEEGRPFLSMEYVEGRPLDSILQHRSLRIPEAIEIGAQVAEALDAAHTRGIVHRDIKPANIVIGTRHQVKVLDFGLAKRFGEETLKEASSSVYQTQTGVVIGTPHYMSPEQVLGREVDGRTDIFSLGVVLYEALVGQRPFLGRTFGEVLNNVVNQEPEPLGLTGPEYAPALEAVVLKCLQKDPQKRFSTARQLADELLELKAKAGATPAAIAPPTPAPGTALAEPAAPAGGGRWRRGNLLLAGAGTIVILGLLAGVFFWPGLFGIAGRGAKAPQAVLQKSVAVLPFSNFSGDPESDYLSDGFTEEVTSALSKIPGLKVAARNSAFTFKGKNEDARKVGHALGVNTLLEGSIRTDGSRIRVSAQLINVATGYHLWSESYDRPLDDILSVQQEIAQRIAEKLQGKAPALQRAKAVDPEAYTLYLQARMFWNRRTPAGLKRAVQLFQGALEKDPTYAAAQAGLAATYLLIPEYIFPARHTEYRPLAKAAAERALQLDPNCAEAHAVLAMLMVHNTEAKAAEGHFRQAIALDPNYATAHHWYGNFLTFQNRLDEALVQYKTGVELDPLSPVTHSTVAQWYYYEHDYPTAVAESRKVIEKFPTFVRIREIMVMAMLQTGAFEESLKAIDEARALQPDTPLALLEFRAYSLARLNRQQEARDIQAQFEEALQQGQPAEGRLALVYAGLREYDKLIDMLEMINATDGLSPAILRDPLTAEIRDLPRFKSLIQKAGLMIAPEKQA